MPNFKPILAAGALALAAAVLARAQGPYAPDTPEPGSVEAIARFTTDARYVSPWVSYVPESASVPSPSDYLGHVAGAAGELSYSDQISGYVRALATASPRVHVETIGRTEEGREILLVAVADAPGIRDLDRLKAATAALADPRATSPEQSERVIAGARPIYYFNAALHADETGSAEMVMELAYRLAVSEQPMIRQIRQRVLVLINPVSNPDGRDKMADWFYRFLKGRTDYATLPRQSPPYWGKYVFVDANRDTHQQTEALTRAVHGMFFAYHPTVVHDLHEGIPLLQTWNGTGPYNPHLDPIVTNEFLEMSLHEMTTMSAMGMPGVWTWKFGEAFGHHYLDSVAMNHNAIGRGYETFGNGSPETFERTISAGETTREWYRPWPADRRFRWSMRDNTNYQETAALAILDFTAKHAPELLRDFYRKGWNSWQKGVTGTPYAFVIPPDQGDRRRVAQMVNVLLGQRIEVSRAVGAFRAGGREFPAGSFVVDLAQPYRNYAVDLLEPQQFPRDSPYTPYDDVSWALPMHYGAEALPIDDVGIRDVPVEPIEGPLHPSGTVSGDGPAFVLCESGQEAELAARFRLSRFAVRVAEQALEVAGRRCGAGTWLIPPQPGLEAALRRVSEELALDFTGVPALPDVPAHEARVPRVGVWVPWADTDSIGWIRYTLDQEKVPYVYLRDEELRAGRLRDAVDVILYGNVDLDLQAQIHGIPSAWGPMPFTRTDRFKYLGTPAASDDITGGIGWAGLANLQQFVEGGGVLVTMGKGTTLAVEGGFVRFVQRASSTAIFTPGAELRARFTQADHPLSYGYGRETTIFRSNYPVYDLPKRWVEMSYCTSCLDGPDDRGPMVMAWGSGDGRAMVVSGGARHEEALEGRPAVLVTAPGAGRVVALNFNPMHRDLNHSDYRVLWNAVLNWEHLPGGSASR